MTTASINTIAHRAHGVERVALTIGLALVRWGRVRVERTAISHDDQARRLELDRVVAVREQSTHRYGIAA